VRLRGVGSGESAVLDSNRTRGSLSRIAERRRQSKSTASSRPRDSGAQSGSILAARARHFRNQTVQWDADNAERQFDQRLAK